MELLVYLFTGMLIGFSAMIYAPKLPFYDPKITEEEIKEIYVKNKLNPESKEDKEMAEKLIKVQKEKIKESMRHMDKKKQEEMQKLIESANNDTYLSLKVYLVKGFVLFIFLCLIFYFLLGTLDPVYIWNELKKETIFYYHLIASSPNNA